MKFITDKPKLERLLKDFYTLTKIRIVVFDEEFCEVASYPNHHSKYCEMLRRDPKALIECSKCDKAACLKSKSRKSTVIYRCYAGLIEAVTPIMQGDITVGYIMFGQVLQTDDYDRSWQEIAPIISGFSVDREELKSAFYKKKNLTPEIISSASSIMSACAGYLYLSKVISVKAESIENRIDKYISEHLAEDLSTPAICGEFGISKSRLYEISSYCYGKGIAEHIKSKRLERAKTLLLEGNLKIFSVAAACGIADYNYFTKIFKKEIGLTPREFRKKHKAKHNQQL